MRLLTYGWGFPHVRVEAENTILQQVSRWLISPSRLANWPALSQRQTAQGLEERRLGATINLGEIQYLIVGSSIILRRWRIRSSCDQPTSKQLGEALYRLRCGLGCFSSCHGRLRDLLASPPYAK